MLAGQNLHYIRRTNSGGATINSREYYDSESFDNVKAANKLVMIRWIEFQKWLKQQYILINFENN